MKILRCGILLLLLTLGVQELLSGQILPFRNYSIEVGLSESVAHDLIQDERGYIWVATGYGLNRFDGQRFRQFYEDQGLANNKVNTLFQDSQFRIWAGTETGVSIVRSDSIHTPDNLYPLSSFPILSVFEDADGNMWFGTDGNGVWKMDPDQNLQRMLTDLNADIQSVRGIDQGPDGVIWIGSREGVVRIDGEEVRYYCHHDGLPEMRTRDVKADPFGRVWIAAHGGLIRFENGEFTVFTREDGLEDQRIQTVTVVDEQTVWIGTENGVSLFDGESFTNYTGRNGLPASIIYSSMIDREGNIWFGTLGGGITIFTGEVFQSYTVDNGLTNNVVTGFTEDSEGRIWIATYGGGALRYDDGELELFQEPDGLIDNKVYTFYRDSSDRIWIGTREGISIYEDGELRSLDPEEYPFTVVRKFYEDPESGEFWIATYNDGVFRLNGDDYQQFYTGNALSNNTVMDITPDREGNIWFATYGGAVRYDGEEFHHITIAEGLPSNGVIQILEDHEGRIWFSTFNGPAYYEDGRVERLIRSEQIETIFYFLEQDDQNRYWFGTNRGLYLLRKELFDAADSEIDRILSYRRYTRKQGLIADELNAGASFISSDGTIWLGTVEGLSRFDPNLIRENRTPPGLEFEEILISGQPASEREGESFLHDHNFIHATYSGLTFEAPEQIVYENRLKGHRDEWYVTRENTASYPALSPGDYTLEVRAYNADGVRSAKTASFSFTVLPPFYFQWWFIVLMILVTAGLIRFSMRYTRVRRQVDIEKMRVQIASDLHDDVGSSLTELALQTDFLQAGELDPQVRDTLRQLGEHSRKIVSSLDDIVWSIDSRNDTAGDLTDRMQDYVNQLFVNGRVDVHYHFDGLKMDKKLPVDVKENVYLIFKESVNNVVKHSNADRVDIHFSFDGRIFELKVQDNGTNIERNRKSGQGLRNIRMRAERMKADVEISPNGGFRVQTKGVIY
jgi:ligand-binding sensor domain-containing protein/two-component sensor histidine kinase